MRTARFGRLLPLALVLVAAAVLSATGLTLAQAQPQLTSVYQTAALPLTDADARNFRRLVFAEAADLGLDAQGRILIPPDLRRYAGLEREALVVGVDTSIEIWSPERWQAVADSLDADGAEIAQRLATLI